MSVLRISLRAGERIFINGAVLRPDRKVTLEFLNSVTFLLEQHVLKPEDTTTPLRQLYFMIQTAIIDPKGARPALDMSRQSLRLLKATFANPTILAELETVEELLERERHFDCLRAVRKLFALEDAIMGGRPAAGEAEPAESSTRNAKVAGCR